MLTNFDLIYKKYQFHIISSEVIQELELLQILKGKDFKNCVSFWYKDTKSDTFTKGRFFSQLPIFLLNFVGKCWN